ncbi:hypothetical protein SAMN02745248_00634 [Hathewaya proteolytica DSM 3090]|uniref:Uncharacterized protein n=1 Tax=Hathewaya proteolytica DSM 3090 TaxID=1121331 RepID=A0A1M6L628_9CLOT|nr:hypothetical protein [Hathewaya proteolytica]SHJ66564.1 hypothetical protein SAMN02745248_00634 [Hathewaya proteolytica DSM 3090]
MKKGFILVEAIIAMFIFMIIVSNVYILFVMECREYREFSIKHKEKMSINDTLTFIESIISQGNGYDILEFKKIVIYEDAGKKKEIFLKNKRIQVVTKFADIGGNIGTNTISMNNIKTFTVNKYGDFLVYIFIETDIGEKYLKCI